MISIEEARELSKNYQVIPVVESLFSGTETPLSIFEKLANDKKGSFLLESAEQGVWSRYSFVGISNLGFLSSEGEKLVWVPNTGKSALPDSSIDVSELAGLDALDLMQRSWRSAPIEGLPPLVSGMVGLMGWDTIQQIETLRKPKPKEFQVPDIAMAVLQDLVVVDHLDSSLKLISNIYLHNESELESEYDNAVGRIESMKRGLLSPGRPFLAKVDFDGQLDFARRTSEKDFISSIEEAKQHLVAGDVFQVVLSQRFEMPVSSSALDVYRMLRALNPSPYMYLLNFEDADGEYAVVGSSPEALVRVSSGKAVLHPIAGSRPRGVSPESDAALAEDLLADAKERAEHLMLVDLARNDLLKVCTPNSVAVTEFMTVERYSHIMHLVSTVEGDLRSSSTAVDVVRSCFPAGTLSGAPKPRALEIIEELEQSNRGLFGGVVGYFDFAGNADLAIAIRTALIRDGKGYVQAGAGIVLDSDPESENKETLAKASAPLRAIAAANSLRRLCS
jgi:anthranilate synthase component 1